MIFLILSFVSVLGLNTASGYQKPDESFVFLSHAAGKNITLFSLDRTSGKLTKLSTTPIEGQAGSMVTSRDGKRLFLAVRETNKLLAFNFNRETLSLQLVSSIGVKEDPAYVALDQSENFLISAYYVAGEVAVHRIQKDGSIREGESKWYPTAKNAHGAAFTKENDFLFIPHTGPNRIYQFEFEQETGELKAAGESWIQRPEQTGPRHVQRHLALPHIFYADNEQDCSLTRFTFDKASRTLQVHETVSTLPEKRGDGMSNARLLMHPNQKVAYVSNRGHNSIACFDVSGPEGKIRRIDVVPTETTPRGFSVSPDGHWMIVAGESSDHIAVYRIGADGIPKQQERIQVDKQPWWVHIID